MVHCFRVVNMPITPKRMKLSHSHHSLSVSVSKCVSKCVSEYTSESTSLSTHPFCKPHKLRFHYSSHSSCLCSFPKFAAKETCDELISLCESEGFRSEKSSDYSQATFDLEVDSSARVREWLIEHKLVPKVSACMMSSHSTCPVSFDDVFVVKYDATVTGGQQGLEWHVDGGDVSFMLALSPRDMYTGGGTGFDCLMEAYDEDQQLQEVGEVPAEGLTTYFKSKSGNSLRPLHLDQGELLIFDAKLYHSGFEISSGVRYLLVGFCFTAAVGGSESTFSTISKAETHGDIGLDLLPLK